MVNDTILKETAYTALEYNFPICNLFNNFVCNLHWIADSPPNPIQLDFNRHCAMYTSMLTIAIDIDIHHFLDWKQG